jgi:hypothetical protein
MVTPLPSIVLYTFRVGENKGQLLPLRCKWFVVKGDEKTALDDVNGAFYQPSIDDVGLR